MPPSAGSRMAERLLLYSGPRAVTAGGLTGARGRGSNQVGTGWGRGKASLGRQGTRIKLRALQWGKGRGTGWNRENAGGFDGR